MRAKSARRLESAMDMAVSSGLMDLTLKGTGLTVRLMEEEYSKHKTEKF